MKKLFSKSIFALLVATVIFSNTAFAQSKSKPKIGDIGPGGGKSDWYLPSREELKYINYKYSDNLKHSGCHLHTTQYLHASGTQNQDSESTYSPPLAYKHFLTYYLI